MKPVILAAHGNEDIARRIAERLDVETGQVDLHQFPDQESYVRINTDVMGRDVVVVTSLDRPDPKFLGLTFLAATAKDLGAAKVGLVCPYLPYMRQDTRFRPGEGVTSAYFAQAISHAFDWLVTVDPHLHRRRALSEIYTIPAIAVHAAPLISDWIRQNVPLPLIIGPDAESEQWAGQVARDAGAPHVVLQKKRTGDYSVEISVPRIDEWGSHTPVLVDDVVSTARTMIEAVRRLRQAGRTTCSCVCVHGLFAGSAHESLIAAGATQVVSCNTIPHTTNAIDVTHPLIAAVRGLLPAATS